MPSTKPLVSFVLGEREFALLDNYRFEHRFESRAAAVKYLLRWALKNSPPKPTDEERRG